MSDPSKHYDDTRTCPLCRELKLPEHSYCSECWGRVKKDKLKREVDRIGIDYEPQDVDIPKLLRMAQILGVPVAVQDKETGYLRIVQNKFGVPE